MNTSVAVIITVLIAAFGVAFVISQLLRLRARLLEETPAVEVDTSDDRMAKKIVHHTQQKVPFMLLAGDKDDWTPADRCRQLDCATCCNSHSENELAGSPTKANRVLSHEHADDLSRKECRAERQSNSVAVIGSVHSLVRLSVFSAASVEKL